MLYASLTAATDSHPILSVLLYPLGFIYIIIGGHQLYTENTLPPVALTLERLASIPPHPPPLDDRARGQLHRRRDRRARALVRRRLHGATPSTRRGTSPRVDSASAPSHCFQGRDGGTDRRRRRLGRLRLDRLREPDARRLPRVPRDPARRPVPRGRLVHRSPLPVLRVQYPAVRCGDQPLLRDRRLRDPGVDREHHRRDRLGHAGELLPDQPGALRGGASRESPAGSRCRSGCSVAPPGARTSRSWTPRRRRCSQTKATGSWSPSRTRGPTALSSSLRVRSRATTRTDSSTSSTSCRRQSGCRCRRAPAGSPTSPRRGWPGSARPPRSTTSTSPPQRSSRTAPSRRCSTWPVGPVRTPC